MEFEHPGSNACQLRDTLQFIYQRKKKNFDGFSEILKSLKMHGGSQTFQPITRLLQVNIFPLKRLFILLKKAILEVCSVMLFSCVFVKQHYPSGFTVGSYKLALVGSSAVEEHRRLETSSTMRGQN